MNPFLSKKRGHEKSMTEYSENAFGGLKTKFGHAEFVLRRENGTVRTFRGCFRGQ